MKSYTSNLDHSQIMLTHAQLSIRATDMTCAIVRLIRSVCSAKIVSAVKQTIAYQLLSHMSSGYCFISGTRRTTMPQPMLDTFGHLVAEKRGRHGIRATAAKIGISPATLSRVENGHLPDLDNFQKICRWLKLDPSHVLGFDADSRNRPIAAVHFRKRQTMELETATALADMILAAQRALIARDDM